MLVFGLDVIGNPYGLAMGVAKGVEAFFYEPFHVKIEFTSLILNIMSTFFNVFNMPLIYRVLFKDQENLLRVLR